MTFFSTIDLNPQRRESRELLSNPQALHASVLSLFPPKTQEAASRVLWRLDTHQHQHTLYVVSPVKPDFSHMVERYGWETAPGQSVEYARFLQNITEGSEWLFRIQVNPTKAIPHHDSSAPRKRGLIIPLVKEEQQVEWFLSKARASGFHIPDTGLADAGGSLTPALRVIENKELVFYKNEASDSRRKVTLRKSILEGQLVVNDLEKFRRTLTEGLGRAKSYGNGLLTIRKP